MSFNDSRRQTSLGWLPNDWQVARLGSVTFECLERNADRALGRDDVLTVDNVSGLVPSTRILGTDFSRYKLVRRDQFAYNPMRLNVGSIALSDRAHAALVSPDYVVFRCDKKSVDAHFLDFFRGSSAWHKQIRRSGQGSVRIRYYYRHIADFYLPVPTLSEQRAIAHVPRTVQRAKEATEQVIAALRELKKSLMRHLFTYGSVPVNQTDEVKLRETETGPVPEKWELVPLGEIARIGNGSTPKRSESRYWKSGTIPWLTSSKVYDTRIRRADQFVTADARAECHLPLVPADSLVVAITGQGRTLGHVGLVTFETCVSQHLAYVTFHRQEVLAEFMLYVLQNRYTHFREVGGAGGSTKGALTCGFLKAYRVPLPPVSMQRMIVSALQDCEASLTTSLDWKSALEVTFRSLLHHLMTGTFRLPPEFVKRFEAVPGEAAVGALR